MLQPSSARLSLDLAWAGGLPARLGLAHVVFWASSVRKILLKRAEIILLKLILCSIMKSGVMDSRMKLLHPSFQWIVMNIQRILFSPTFQYLPPPLEVLTWKTLLFMKEFSARDQLVIAHFLKTPARLSSDLKDCQLGSARLGLARKIPARLHH